MLINILENIWEVQEVENYCHPNWRVNSCKGLSFLLSGWKDRENEIYGEQEREARAKFK